MTPNIRQLSLSNQRILERNIQRRIDFRIDPSIIHHWFSRCRVRVLLVTDGGLDFGEGDFGLSTFVRVLQNDAPSRVRFDITVAHLRSGVTDAQVMMGAPGIVRSIKGFLFDDPGHFAPDTYDQVWLFGIETNFHNGAYPARSANPAKYPAGRLGNEELARLDDFMWAGGGVFATGDHGELGRALCGSVPRVRSMRHWASFTLPGSTQDEVSMSGPKRNDTNHVGHDAGTQFSDQSDDIPQRIDPVLYSSRLSKYTSARYPHPLLCGVHGIINVLPDHPHEGECRTPATLTDKFGGRDEYPLVTGGGYRVSPEVIANSRVPAGNTADFVGSKQATVAHTFGAISAYDGARAGIGRVVCDATWHHFVNVNLIGVVEGGGFDQFSRPGEDPTKHDGFLSTTAGGVALDMIKNYYTNIGVWISPPARRACFNTKVWWQMVYSDRVMEASLVNPDIAFQKIPVDVFYSIGTHARDAFGRRASQCQSIIWTLDWLREFAIELVPWIDPWDPVIRFEKTVIPPLPVVDLWPVVHTALGAALVAMRQSAPYPPEHITEQHVKIAEAVRLKAGKAGLKLSMKQLSATCDLMGKSLRV